MDADAGSGPVDAAAAHVLELHKLTQSCHLVRRVFFFHREDKPCDVLRADVLRDPDDAEVSVAGKVESGVQVSVELDELGHGNKYVLSFTWLIQRKGDKLAFFVGRNTHVCLLVDDGSDAFLFCFAIGFSLIIGCLPAFVAQFELPDFYPSRFFKYAVEEALFNGGFEIDTVEAEAVVLALPDEFVEESAFSVVVGAEDDERESPGGTWFCGFKELLEVLVVSCLIDDDLASFADDGCRAAGDDSDRFSGAERDFCYDVVVNGVFIELGDGFDDDGPDSAVFDELFCKVFVARGDVDIPVTVCGFGGRDEGFCPGHADLPTFFGKFAQAFVAYPLALVRQKQFLQRVLFFIRRHRCRQGLRQIADVSGL